MVCKDELCTWFRSLSSHRRIDYMCGLLLVCHPLELRFIGSSVEDLGKRDFHCLREFESKANSHHELSKLNCANDNCLTRETMALNLALLHSSNTTCANVIFSFLEINLERAFTATNDLNIDTVLLVFTMAMHHPAFSHYQRTRMYECFQNAEKNYAESLAKKVESQEESPMSFFNEENGLSPSKSQSTSSAPSSNLHKVFVNSIELKDTKKLDRGHKCRLEVTWSNGEVTEAFKTYTELQDFVSRLKKIFPEDACSAKLEENTLSHGTVQTGCKVNTMDAELDSIARYLPKLPQHMMECENLNQFFCVSEASSPLPTSPSNKGPSVDDENVISYSPAKSLTVYNSQLPHGSAGFHHTKTCSSVPPVTVTAPTHRHSCPVRNSPPQMSCSCLTTTVSPVDSRSSSPNVQFTNPTAQIQKPLGLDCNVPYSAEALPFGREDNDRAGISHVPMGMEPMNRMKGRNFPNGIVNPMPDGVMSHGVPWQTHPTNVSYQQTAAHHNQPVVYPVPYQYQAVAAITPNEAVRDSPSTGSDTSSHSPSPVSHTKHQLLQTASSSEELDKADHLYKSVVGKMGESKKKGSQLRGNNHQLRGSNPQSRGSNHQSKTKPDTSVINKPVHDNISSTCVNAKPEGRPINGGSGFISDPTGFSPRPPGMIKVHCKAQPVQPQTRICEDGQHRMKVPIGFAHPMSAMSGKTIAQPLSNSHASISAHSNNAVHSESPHRSAIYRSNACARSQSPVTNGTNRLPVCTVSTATSVTISTGANQLTQHMIPASKSLHSILPSGSAQESGVVDQSVQASPLVRNGSPASVSATISHGTSSYGQASPNPSVNRATCSPLCSRCGNHANTEHSYPGMVSTTPFPNLLWPPNAVITPGSNGLIQTPMAHNVQYHFPPNFPNGINPELLYANQPPNYRIFQPGQTPLPMTGIIFGYNPYKPTYQSTNSMNKPKKMYCHNCGSSKHQAGECSENSMESMSGNYNINYKPDSD